MRVALRRECRVRAPVPLRPRRILSGNAQRGRLLAELRRASLRGLLLERSANLADLREAALATLQLRRQVLRLLADAVEAILLGVDRFAACQ